MKIYISGKITGLPAEEYKPLFQEAEDLLTTRFNAVEVINPCKIDHLPDATYEEYMLRDIAELFCCDAIYMLPNWKDSRGARMEHAIAIEMDITVIYQ